MIPIHPAGAVKTPSATAAETGDKVTSVFLQPGKISLPASPPLSLYVHVPWCVRKCPYCDFNSHAEPEQGIPEERFLAAVRQDLEAALPMVWGRHVHTIFIGGGTPSLLSAQGLDRLLSDIRMLLPIDADAEITMEANPGTFEAERFRSYRASGVNRLSIGIQSFNDAHLQALGRIHSAAEARAAIDIARAHFDNINLDLMFALPGQTLAECEADVEAALSFDTNHVSLYHLTLEPNTYFAKYPPALPDDDTAYAMQDWIHARLAAAGYEHYEVSAYAKTGKRSKHNLNYWQFGDYLGIGPGAHGKLSFPHRVIREMRHKHPDTYLRQAETAGGAAVVQEQREVDAADLPFEFMLNALRLTDGFPVTLFQERTGLPLRTIERELDAAEQRGLLSRDHVAIRPTELGQRFLNDLQELFLADDKN